MKNDFERNAPYNKIMDALFEIQANNDSDFNELNTRIGYLEQKNNTLISYLESMLNELKK